MKTLINFALRRPVTVTAFYILVVALAVAAYLRLPVALLPDLRFPALMIWTAYPDVAPERVERAVTERIEEAVAGTPGLRRLSSRSQLGGSLVRLDFGWNVNLDLAVLEIREQLDRLGNGLPDETERPIVLRLDPSDRPLMMIAVGAGERHRSPAAATSNDLPGETPLEDFTGLKPIARDIIARRLEQLDGVARVRVTGGYEWEIEITLDPGRMATHGLSLDQVGRALSMANVAVAGGTVRRGPFRYAVEVSGEFLTIGDVADAVISERGKVPIRLREVATVQKKVSERRGFVRLDGRETLLLLVERRPEANTVQTAAQARQALSDLDSDLPGVHLDVVVDESRFIEAAIEGVLQAILIGGLLAIGVLFAFLRRPRALAAVAVAVPLSLAITLVLFDILDIDFNLISLGGLALGAGMLVDNAIVVAENIARLRETGHRPAEAASRGTAEVALAITASTLTTIAVFLPLTFVEGLAGRLFRDQALAVTCSLAASLFVALTAVPLMAARDRDLDESPVTPSTRWFEPYEKTLDWCLAHRGWVLLLNVALLLVSTQLIWQLPREAVPRADQGRLEVKMTLPAEADLSLVDQCSKLLEYRLLRWPEVRQVLADLGERDESRLAFDPRPPYEGDLILILESGADIDATLAKLRSLPVRSDIEIRSNPIRTQLEELLVGDHADFLIDLVSDRRHESMPAADGLRRALRNRPELVNVGIAEKEQVPAYHLRFRHEAMLRFGVRTETIATYFRSVTQGHRATALHAVNEEIPIVLRAGVVSSLERLLAVRLPTPNGLFPVGTFVDAKLVPLPAALLRAGQAPIVRLTADTAPGVDLAAATAAIRETLEGVLPVGVRGYIRGTNDAFRSSLRAVGWSLVLSLLLVYLILCAQFESLLQPLVILATVPLAVGGVVMALRLTGQSLNLMSLTGCVVLVGILVNDGIVKVDFINQRLRAGLSLTKAIHQAGRDRVRPILMTSLTTILGLLPLALGIGQGAELRAPLAIAIGGGLASGTVLTLLTVPVLYSFVEGRRPVKRGEGWDLLKKSENTDDMSRCGQIIEN